MLNILKSAIMENREDIADLALNFKQVLGPPVTPKMVPSAVLTELCYNFETYEEDVAGNDYVKYCPKINENDEKKAIRIDGNGDCLFSVSFS